MSIDGEDTPIKRVTKLLERVPATDEWESVPHTDIDIGDETDPQLCCVYVNDIYTYLRENEVCSHHTPANPSFFIILILPSLTPTLVLSSYLLVGEVSSE